ncbi:MAG: hypothetical protein HY815_29375 [Candidatus Riflebacteria bacterium]|nr:hypothetical protein [Candidatus Riflebacteria bacterium]
MNRGARRALGLFPDRGLASLLVLALAGGADAGPAVDQEKRLQELERQLKTVTEANAEFVRRQAILTQEIRKVRDSMTLPEEKKLASQYGMGPAASKVYTKERGLSIGGYGQTFYTAQVEDKNPQTGVNTIDQLRFVIYNGYKFSDKIVLNSEIEYEHAATGNGGSVSVEFAQIDFLLGTHFNVRAGLLLLPMGFINEIHEPNFYHGNERPEVERVIIPTTWRENGLGCFGNFSQGWSYRAYLVNSMRGASFTSAGIRPGRQNGAQARADDFSVVLRTDYDTGKGFVGGASVYRGHQGNEESLTVDSKGRVVKPEIGMTLVEIHAQYRRKALELRGLAAWTTVNDAYDLSLARARASSNRGPVSERQHGYYLEVAYDILKLIKPKSDQYLALFGRYEDMNTQARVPFGFAPDLTQDRELRTVGVSYKPHPQLVIKLDHRDWSQARGSRADELNLGMGWVF